MGDRRVYHKFTSGKAAIWDAESVATRLFTSIVGDCLAHQGTSEDAVIETREAEIELGSGTIGGLPVQGKEWHEDDPDRARAKLRKGKGRRTALPALHKIPRGLLDASHLSETNLQRIDDIRLDTTAMR
jgi:hypothetical protein